MYRTKEICFGSIIPQCAATRMKGKQLCAHVHHRTVDPSEWWLLSTEMKGTAKGRNMRERGSTREEKIEEVNKGT